MDPVDAVIAGPLTDVLPRAVAADVAPVLGLCWAFDLLIELAEDPQSRDQVSSALARASWVHADCEDMRQRLLHLGARADRVSVAPWGIDLECFTPGPVDPVLRAAAGAGPRDTLVLTTRSWEPGYGVEVVLDGFARAHRQRPGMRLAWAGTGSLERSLRRRVRALGIGGAVVEIGRLEASALRRWLRTADVYVSASLSDGSSLSLMEALACGLRPVVTDLPSNREWVTGPAVGGLFDPRNPGSLARALLDGTPSSGGEAARLRRAIAEDRADWRRNQQVLSRAVAQVLEDARA